MAVENIPFYSTLYGRAKFSDMAYYIHLLPENLIRSSANLGDFSFEHFLVRLLKIFLIIWKRTGWKTRMN